MLCWEIFKFANKKVKECKSENKLIMHQINFSKISYACKSEWNSGRIVVRAGVHNIWRILVYILCVCWSLQSEAPCVRRYLLSPSSCSLPFDSFLVSMWKALELYVREAQLFCASSSLLNSPTRSLQQEVIAL